MTELTGEIGFTSPMTEKTFSKRRRAGVELMATIALAISLVIAATAVSIGMARAQALYAVGTGNGPPAAVAALLGALAAGKIH